MDMVLGATLYVRNSVAAVDFYCRAFGMAVGYSQKNSEGTYLHAELEKAGRSIFAVSESGDWAICDQMLSAVQPTMSLGINFPNDAEMLHAYHSLVEGGHILRPLGSVPWSPLSADVVDRYGVCWYLYVSQNRPDESEER